MEFFIKCNVNHPLSIRSDSNDCLIWSFLSPLSKKPEIFHSPSFVIKNPYIQDSYEKIKKEYNSPFLASIVPSIFSNFYMTPINLINTNYIYHNNTNLKKILSSNINSKIYSGLNIEILRKTFMEQAKRRLMNDLFNY